MNEILFSILIPTLEDRSDTLKKLIAFIEGQISSSGNSDCVEILTEVDNRERTTGAKRNTLLQRAKGKLSAFVDDDDWLSDSYIEDIINIIKSSEGLDCIGFFGNVYFSGTFHGNMIHTTLCDNWTCKGTTYYRPPNHLNPIRTELSKQIQFKDITISEDFSWSMDLRSSGLIKNEVYLGNKPLYFYYCGGHIRTL